MPASSSKASAPQLVLRRKAALWRRSSCRVTWCLAQNRSPQRVYFVLATLLCVTDFVLTSVTPSDLIPVTASTAFLARSTFRADLRGPSLVIDEARIHETGSTSSVSQARYPHFAQSEEVTVGYMQPTYQSRSRQRPDPNSSTRPNRRSSKGARLAFDRATADTSVCD